MKSPYKPAPSMYLGPMLVSASCDPGYLKWLVGCGDFRGFDRTVGLRGPGCMDVHASRFPLGAAGILEAMSFCG